MDDVEKRGPEKTAQIGLCATCRFAQIIRSSKDAAFWRCGRSFEDPRYRRYPTLPRLTCDGFEADSSPDSSVG